MLMHEKSCLIPILQWAKIKDDSSVFIFSTLSACKDGFKIRKQCKALTYSSLRELFVETFKPHVSDVTKYCLHSLRARGASSAANNGVPDRLFKKHGPLRRHAYSNILKLSPPKNEKFQIKKNLIFFKFLLKT